MRASPTLLAALAALSACGDPTATPDAGVDVGPDAPPALAVALTAAGFTVQVGDAFGFGLADCADLPDCYASNASGSYVLFSVPPTPGGALPPLGPTTVNPPRTPAGQSVAWQLGAHEAVVIAGITPPPARYWSVAPYLFERADGGARATVFASLADATNPINVAHVGASPFAARVAFIVAADAGVLAQARAGLIAAGWDPRAINPLPLAPDVVRLGTGGDADTVMALGRVALVDDPAAGAAYLADVPLEVLRLTATAPPPPAPLPAPPRTPPHSATDERSLEPAVDALEAAIRARLGAARADRLLLATAAQVAATLAPAGCIARLANCLGEVSDTVYAAGPLDVVLGGGALTLADDPGDYFLVFGVNHEAAGLATYSNVVVTHWAKRAGVLAFESPAMVGSAAAYLPDHPDRDRLFVVTIARRCGGAPYCLELPTSFPGVPLDQTLAFLFRAYLAPGAALAPDPAALVTERVIHVTP